jgi:hypothetical protein
VQGDNEPAARREAGQKMVDPLAGIGLRQMGEYRVGVDQIEFPDMTLFNLRRGKHQRERYGLPITLDVTLATALCQTSGLFVEYRQEDSSRANGLEKAGPHDAASLIAKKSHVGAREPGDQGALDDIPAWKLEYK